MHSWKAMQNTLSNALIVINKTFIHISQPLKDKKNPKIGFVVTLDPSRYQWEILSIFFWGGEALMPKNLLRVFALVN